MDKQICEIILPKGKVIKISYGKLKCILVSIIFTFIVLVLFIGYFYNQLADYRNEASAFQEYKIHKEEQKTKLQQLLNDNEKMLRDMAEISNLEKKLRRAVIRDLDSNKLTTESTVPETSNTSSYIGKGSGKTLDSNSSIAVLEAQNKNIMYMLNLTRNSVSELLSEVEGRSGTLASFPNIWPTDGGLVSSNYGGRVDPVSGGYEYHCGLDIAVDFGTPVYATAAGQVEQAGWNGGYGRFIKINHGNGYETAYGHMSSLIVNQGQKVAKGEIIGFVGSSGYSTGPHVHYEVLADGQNIDPGYVLKK